MKLIETLLVTGALTLAALATPGCANDANDANDALSATSQDLTTAAWQKLGETRVDGDFDHDVITVGADDGRFRAIQLHVEDGDLVMFNVKVVFGNGDVFEPNVRFVFDEHTRSRVIDLPGELRFIRRVEFQYGNIPGGPRAKVQLFGKNATPPPDWMELGERSVDGMGDHDTIIVGGDEGPFTAIQVRVKRSALVMQDIRVTFGNGEVFEPHVRLVFDENTRSRVIDLPGNRRFIKRVDFKYSDLPGGGDARVQVWATL